MSDKLEEIAFSTHDIDAASKALYQQSGDIADEEKRFPDAIPFYKRTDNRKDHPAGYVIYHNGGILVSYRGTSNVPEWLDNLRARPSSMDLENGERVHVHAGFKHEYKLSKKSMEEAIEKMQNKKGHSNNKEVPITFSGHSLGGAISQLAAIEHKAKDKERDIQVITFGSPRVFCKNATKIYNKHLGNKTLRIAQSGDPVPAVPPRPAYEHAGSYISMPVNKKNLTTHMTESYRNIAGQISKKFPNVDGNPGVTGAKLIEYRKDKRLKKLIVKNEIKEVNKDIKKERIERIKAALSEASNGNISSAKTTILNPKKHKELLAKKANMR